MYPNGYHKAGRPFNPSIRAGAKAPLLRQAEVRKFDVVRSFRN